MTAEKRPGPSKPFQKANGKWTFYIYPKGEGDPQEHEQYNDEEFAVVAALEVWKVWKVNGETYGELGTKTSQSNVQVVQDPRL